MYVVPTNERVCLNCKYRDYDTYNKVLYCTHKPLAEGLSITSILNNYGTCEHFEKHD